MQKTATVIYHKNCPSGDGFGSAFAAWLKLGDSADYHPADYDDAPPDVTDRDVYILDLSFPAEVLTELSRRARSLTLLDHHLTAKNRLSAFRPVCCGKIHFDLTKCGAVLAWEHFHPDEPVPQLFKWLQDRDLWTWNEPGTKEFLAWLDTQPKTFAVWEEIFWLGEEELTVRRRIGAELVKQTEVMTEAIARNATPVVIAGESGLMVNSSGVLRSEVGGALAERSKTFGLVWRVVEGGKVLCSLRSYKPYDVEQLALKFGGGGHPTAASFTLSVERLAELALGRLEPNR